MKKIFLVLLVACGSFLSGSSQDYNSAVGLRLGIPTSITYKKFVAETKAFEAFAGWRSRGTYNEIRANLAYQVHSDLGDVDMLKWYWGFGGGVIIYSLDSNITDDGGLSLQANGYLGLEYTLEGVPLVISLDWVPTLAIGGYSGANRGQFGLGALAIRYILD